MTLWSKTITYLPSTDISAPEKFVKLDPFTLVGTGDIRNATLLLNSRKGAFLTNSNGGTTPILSPFDKIKISLTDKNGNTKSLVGIIDDEKPVRKGGGPVAIVNLFGQERWLQKIHMPAMKMERISHYDAIRKIIDIYNENRGTSQVIIEKHDDVTFNEAPQWTAVNIDFSDKPTLYDALMRVISKLNTTIANQGGNDFFELYFEDDPADAAKIRIKVFVSGSLPASPITIQQSDTTRIYDISGTLEGKRGTVLIGEGADGFGGTPLESIKYWSRLEQFNLHPQHNGAFTYPSGAKVQKDGVHYQSNTSTSNDPPHADWDIIKIADEIGLIRPSPYTYKKSAFWENSGSNPTGIAGGTGTGFDQEGMWDGNIVVRDEDHYRNWVHLKSTTDNFDVFYKYGAASGGVYRGLRCLINGTGINGFTGNDINGVAFTNSIVQYDGTNWIVIRTAQTDDVCAVRKEGKNYLFNGTWSDDSANIRANDCFHIYTSIGNDTGVASSSKQKGDGTWLDLDGDSSPDTGETYGTDSAVKVVYEYSPFSAVTSSILTVDNYYSIGSWLNWEMAPIPCNTNNSITESIGEIYGGDSTKKEPATFDMDGTFGLSPSGKQGWNSDDAEENGPKDSIKFALKFRWEYIVSGDAVPNGGNFKFRVIVYDTSDNVFYKDITILDADRFEFFELFADEFQVYRARAPLKWGNIASNLIVPELEVLEKFEWKNAKLMCLQWQESYDEQGRYSPESRRPITGPLIAGGGLLGVRTILHLDVFNFGGQLVASTGKDTTLNIEPEFFQRPSTSNYEQLKQDMEAQKELEQHPFDAWEINGEAILDRDFGESVYLKDTDLINDSDNGPNTKKIVVKEFSIAINGTDGGAGGFTGRTFGAKRI